MAKDVQTMLAEANVAIGTVSVEEVRALLGDAGVLILDVREPGEVEKGKIVGAIAVPRGLLEFEADPASPLHPALDRAKRVVVTCGSGGRGALAGKTLLDMGFADVRQPCPRPRQARRRDLRLGRARGARRQDAPRHGVRRCQQPGGRHEGLGRGRRADGVTCLRREPGRSRRDRRPPSGRKWRRTRRRGTGQSGDRRPRTSPGPRRNMPPGQG